MSFKLVFHEDAGIEWRKLDRTVAEQFKKKLKERLENPRILSAKVSGGADLYKIKLRTVGYRLVYQVIDAQVIVLVLSVGKREKNAAYTAALGRL
ncbi:type II toxin-antitoxin system RelE/ParE family toxin [uncultured Deefgea sp.]|uniref:type II toxin-antitoxin system RelE family toxin n=1 Tax=uncultured Deefgea sp. TaxID=1304914 RepID=UPI0026038A8E|nr:type II toxin-antitoxin system RelE/ParE family toxin [uncultured Deefgea sp.]